MTADTEPVDPGRRRAFTAGAAALGAIAAGAPKAAEAANSPPPFLAIKQAQAVGDGVTDDTAAFARFDAAGGGWIMPYAATGTIFYIAGTWAPSHRVIIAPGVILKLGAGASVKLADLVILDDGHQCFDVASGGTLSFGRVNRISPYCFGAKGDGVTDDTAACAAAMKAVPANGEMVFLHGTFAIGGNLPRTQPGVTIRGERARITKKSGVTGIHFFTAAPGNRFIGLNLNAGETIPMTAGSFGIYSNIASPASNVEVAHCVFNDIFNAVRGDGAVGWNIHDNSGSGFFVFIECEHSVSAPISRLRIAGNNFSNCQDAGIALNPYKSRGAASFIEISGNVIQDTNLGNTPGNAGIAIDMGEDDVVGAVTDVLVHGNLVRQLTASPGTAATRGAIGVSYITRASVRDNVCIGLGTPGDAAPWSQGIWARSAVNSVIANNEIYNFYGGGITAWGTTDLDILDNSIVNCGGGTIFAGINLNYIGSGVTTTGVRVKGNRVTVLSGYAATAAGIFLTGDQSGAARNSGIEIDDNTVEGIIGVPAITVVGGGSGQECLLDRICNNRIVNSGFAGGGIQLVWTVGALVQGNKIYDAHIGVGGSNNAGLQLLGNHIYDDGGTTAAYVSIGGTNTGCSMIGNVLEETGSGAPAVSFAGATILRNQGYVTENSGTAGIGPGATSVTVHHGLAVTPTAGQISVTPNGNIAPATQFWVGAIGAGSFTVNLNRAPAAAVTFGWSARLP